MTGREQPRWCLSWTGNFSLHKAQDGLGFIYIYILWEQDVLISSCLFHQSPQNLCCFSCLRNKNGLSYSYVVLKYRIIPTGIKSRCCKEVLFPQETLQKIPFLCLVRQPEAVPGLASDPLPSATSGWVSHTAIFLLPFLQPLLPTYKDSHGPHWTHLNNCLLLG